MEMARAQQAEPIEEQEPQPEDAAEATSQEAAEKKKGRPKLIFIIAAILLLGSGGFAAKKFLLKGPEKGAAEATAHQEPHEPGQILYLGEEFIVNLSGGGYVRAKIALELGIELKGGGHGESVGTEFMPALRDIAITVLSDKSRSELAGSEGMQKTKEELVERINEEFAARGHEGFAREAYFTYLAVQ